MIVVKSLDGWRHVGDCYGASEDTMIAAVDLLSLWELFV